LSAEKSPRFRLGLAWDSANDELQIMRGRLKRMMATVLIALALVVAVTWFGGLGNWAAEHIQPLPLGNGRNISFCADGPTLSLCYQRDLPADELRHF